MFARSSLLSKRHSAPPSAGNIFLSHWERAGVRDSSSTAYRLPPAAYQRRGVLLLVVLSLLILFVMIAVTYVVVASRHRAANKAYALKDITGDPPRQQLDAAMMQVLRGSANAHSPLYPWSLLEHMYGTNWVSGTATGSQLLVNNQILDFKAALPVPSGLTSTPEGYYEGCVLTFNDSRSAAKGISARIVRHYYESNGTQQHIRVLTPKSNGATFAASDFDNYTFIINGRAFSGTGFGYKSGSVLDAKDTNSYEFALMPNPTAYVASGDYAAGTAFGGTGGGNMDYDAPDYQHMWMSWTVDGGGTTQVVLPSFHRPDLINYWLERKRRQTNDLNWNWDNPTTTENHTDPISGATLTDEQFLLERIMLRPNPIDHPNFSGSNSAMTGANWSQAILGQNANGNFISPWDVDNDGDGINDSVWLDLGYPVQSTADGRLFKPLFAIHCVDLDGRLNVNAHGTTEQIATSDSYAHTARPTPAGPFAGSAAATQHDFPRGEGYGPAEIDLTLSGISNADVVKLLRGDSASGYQGRYGGDPTTGKDEAGINNQDDNLGLIKHFQYPDPSYTVLSSFGSPSDLWGDMSIGVDYNGQPYFMKPTLGCATPAYTSGLQGETRNSPYDLNLSHDVGNAGNAKNAATADNPFTAFELESLLRPYDIDTAELPSRLSTLLKNSIVSTPSLRNRLTTESWDLPSPSNIPPKSHRTSLPQSVGEMLWHKLQSGASPLTAANANKAIRDLVSPDLIAGLRMNINRPLGDGRDSLGLGIVDVPIDTEIAKDGQSSATNKWAPNTVSGFSNVTFNLTNGMNVTGPDPSDKFYVAAQDEVRARQLMARYLYVLARLLIDDAFLGNPTSGSPKNPENHWTDNDPAVTDGPTQRKASIRKIAQWAVNVVDFMDADSIMTPFEYDEQPFSHFYVDSSGALTDKDNNTNDKWRTWCVDGIVGDGVTVISADDDETTHPWRGLVWGCERPELLITETLSFHDRRTEDLSSESHDDNEATLAIPGDSDSSKSSGKTASQESDPNKQDGSFDQRLMPRSGFFVELYNPWADNGTNRPGEFYSAAGGVVLNGMSGGSNPSPIWRLLVVKDNKDPDDPNNPAPASDIDRSVYFTNMTPAGLTLTLPTDDGTRYYSDLNVAPLLPGRYAVVGSSGNDPPLVSGSKASYEITIGRKKLPATEGTTSGNRRANLQIDTTQRIILTPLIDPNMNQVQVASTTGSVDALSQPPEVQSEIAVVINQPRSLSITEPNPNLTLTPPRPMGYPTASNDPVLISHSITWDSTLAGGEGAYNPPIDVPLDYDLSVQTDPTLLSVLQQNRYLKDFRRVHLQRLANPLLPWNAKTNPYRTIDSMSVPLTVFNGVEDFGNAQLHPDPISGDNPDRIATHQRGDENPAPTSERNLWHHDFTVADSSNTPVLAADSGYFFGRPLQHTLGFLNKAYGPALTSAAPFASYAGSPDTSKSPFPWLVWNNRPYASVNELMLVPACQSSQLARQFTTLDGVATLDPYSLDANAAGTQRIPFGHTLNFFRGETSAQVGIAPNLALMLEYLQVPSPFVGTETVLNPTNFAWNCNTGNNLAGEASVTGDIAPNITAGNEPTGTKGLHPPFNTVSNFRDPGKVNINTISSDGVWNGVQGFAAGAFPGATYNDIVQSRQGYTGAAYAFDSAHPSIFSNPFRSAAGADMVPLSGLAHKPVNVTFWRADGVDPESNKVPLLAKYVGNTPSHPLDDYKDWQRNPFFYYQSLGRLTNKLTTRSNVYAVWVTVGYFEVTPWYGYPTPPSTTYPTSGPVVIDTAHPDGYQLGQELGADTGEIERHRGFYIIDRSIPVGFQRGVDNNDNNAVLLRRFIE